MVLLKIQRNLRPLRQMHVMGCDILQPIAEKDIPRLRDFYKEACPRAYYVYIYNYLASLIKWKTLYPDTKYFRIYIPDGGMKDGTFISTTAFGRSEIYLHTLEHDRRTLYEALVESKRFDWKKSWVFHALAGILHPVVTQALERTAFQRTLTNVAHLWHIPRETAINFELEYPDDVYVAPLKPSHAKLVNSVWFARTKTTEVYWTTLIKMNGGYGVFLKSNGELVSWVVRNLSGRAALQTVDSYKRKGYATLITKYLSKTIAQDGYEPLSIVHKTNVVQQNLLSKLGFQMIGEAFHIYNKEYTSTMGSAAD